jgi:hypothetical protein
MRIPTDVRIRVKGCLWEQADKLEWDSLGSVEKARHYTQWTDSQAIGGVLSTYMDPRSVRVYIKDTLLKGYSRYKLNEHEALILRLTGHDKSNVAQEFIKPHGLSFTDGSIVAWGRADDWKVLLGSLFERAFGSGGQPTMVAFFRAAPRFVRPSSQDLVETAARRLGIERCVWFD